MTDLINDMATFMTEHVLTDDPSLLTAQQPHSVKLALKKVAILAYSQCEKDMREKASDGFDEFRIQNSCTDEFDGRLIPNYNDLQLWQAATLSADKRHAEEIRVKDERIETLFRKAEKLKSLILLTDYSVADNEMNDTARIQWNSFILDFPDESPLEQLSSKEGE